LNSTGNRDKFDFEKLDIIKRYFSRIYSVISKDVRNSLLKLDVSKKELKEILKAIAFLPEDKQKEFLKELMDENED